MVFAPSARLARAIFISIHFFAFVSTQPNGRYTNFFLMHLYIHLVAFFNEILEAVVVVFAKVSYIIDCDGTLKIVVFIRKYRRRFSPIMSFSFLLCLFLFLSFKMDSVQSSSNTCKNYLLKIYSQHGNFLNAI